MTARQSSRTLDGMTETTLPAGPLRRVGILTLILAVLFQVTVSVAGAVEGAPR